MSADRPSRTSLKGVNVILIANPNASAVGTNLPPKHIEAFDRRILSKYVREGGGLILFGNQENHNLEVEHVNLLLAKFGLALRNDYTDFKRVRFPAEDPVVGGLKWAFYSGNRVELLPNAKTLHARGWYLNSSKELPERGERSVAGYLMASAEAGKGRVLVATDSGWIGNNAMNGVGINGFYMADHDNAEIMTRIVRWASGRRR